MFKTVSKTVKIGKKYQYLAGALVTTERETYDTSERNGSYVPIQTNPEDDALQLHTDGEIPGENKSNNIIRRSYRNIVKPNRYGSIPYTGNFWG